MKKTLIQAKDLDSYICRSAARIFIDGSAVLLTPGARDELARRGVSIIQGPCPEAAGCALHSGGKEEGRATANNAPDAGFEKLLFSVAAILQTEYGITDLAQLQALSAKAAEAIRRNM